MTIIYDSSIYNKKLKVRDVQLSPLETNCYILCDEESKVGAVIDPGDCNKILTDAIKDMGIEKLEYIILTHGHFDHTYGVSELKKLYPDAVVCINKYDEHFILDENSGLFGFKSIPFNADRYLENDDIIKIGTSSLRVMETPGHTRGSVVLYNDDYMFTGDTLFCKEIGRCDLPTGDYEMMLDSLRKIKKLKNNYVIYPGHGISTSLDSEKLNNRYLLNLGE
ncbi:MAG: MBL fold metallo-hydrolase [Clostridia bacterium]|nr:MBL fold metallo-hydrolase [Clostridia bacterium]